MEWEQVDFLMACHVWPSVVELRQLEHTEEEEEKEEEEEEEEEKGMLCLYTGDFTQKHHIVYCKLYNTNLTQCTHW